MKFVICAIVYFILGFAKNKKNRNLKEKRKNSLEKLQNTAVMLIENSVNNIILSYVVRVFCETVLFSDSNPLHCIQTMNHLGIRLSLDSLACLCKYLLKINSRKYLSSIYR